MNNPLRDLMVQQTIQYSNLLIQCAEPRKAYAVLTEDAPASVLEHPEVVERARLLATQIDQAFDDGAYLKRYGAYTNGGEMDRPFSDVGLLSLFRAQATIELASNLKPKRYLSVGGGEGTVVREVMRSSPETKVTLSELLGVGGAVAEALEAEFPGRVQVAGRFDVDRDWGGGEEYDFIECLEVLEHVVNDWVLLSNLRFVLAPGGKLILSTPNSEDWIESKLLAEFGEGNWYHHLEAYTPKKLTALMLKAGLKPTIALIDKTLFCICEPILFAPEVDLEATYVAQGPEDLGAKRNTPYHTVVTRGWTPVIELAGKTAPLVAYEGNLVKPE